MEHLPDKLLINETLCKCFTTIFGHLNINRADDKKTF